MLKKIFVDQELVKKQLKMGITSYSIAQRQKLPRPVVEGIRDGKDRPWFRRRIKIKKPGICECCGIRKKTGRKLCQACFEENSGSVGDDEFEVGSF